MTTRTELSEYTINLVILRLWYHTL